MRSFFQFAQGDFRINPTGADDLSVFSEGLDGDTDFAEGRAGVAVVKDAARIVAEIGEVKLIQRSDGAYWFDSMPAVCRFEWFKFAMWCVASAGGDDVNFREGDVPVAKIDGAWHRLQSRPFRADELFDFAAEIRDGQASAGQAILNGVPLDGNYSLRIQGAKHFRFRVCGTAVEVDGSRKGLSFILRTGGGIPPSCEDLGLPEPVTKMFDAKAGLVLVCGSVGSGKTTLIAAGCRRISTSLPGRNLITFEAPVEFNLLSIPDRTGAIAQSNVGPHQEIDNFHEATKNALRRNPDVVLFGEARDRESIEGMIRASLLGKLVITTLHTNSASGVFARIASEYPVTDQHSVFINTLSAVRGVVFQVLVSKPGGGRKAVIEYIYLTREMKEEILDGGIDNAELVMQKLINARGRSFMDSLQEVYENGECTDEDYQLHSELHKDD